MPLTQSDVLGGSLGRSGLPDDSRFQSELQPFHIVATSPVRAHCQRDTLPLGQQAGLAALPRSVGSEPAPYSLHPFSGLVVSPYLKIRIRLTGLKELLAALEAQAGLLR